MASEIKIYGQKYQLSKELENYVNVRKEFQNLSEKYGKLYEKELLTDCHNVEAIVNKAYKLADNYFNKAGDVILDRLATNDIYTVRSQDILDIVEECGILDPFEKGFSAIEKVYYNIIQKAEEAKRQRELRKESRARFVGGGFGIDGAIRGIIKAELLNQVTGLGHSAFNAFGNARTEREKQEQLDNLHFIAITMLSGAFKESIANYYIAMLIVLNKYEIISFEWPSKKDEEQAKAILENLEAGRIPKEKINSALYNLVTLDPFNMNMYSYVLKNQGDSKNELEKFGEMHGINIHSMKDSIINDLFLNDINELCEVYKKEKEPVQFEKQLFSIQSKIDKKKKFLGLTRILQCEKLIEKELNKLNIRFKTVDGVIFKSIEEAKLAKKDLNKFYEYISIHGIESEAIREEINKLEFKTNIVTVNLDKRLEGMKLLNDDKELGKRINNILIRKGFTTASTRDDYSFAKKVFIIGVSKEFKENAQRAKKLAKIDATEKIVLIFKNRKRYEGDFTWWVLSTNNLYTFDNDDDDINDIKVVSYLDIEFIHADNKGNLITRIRGGVDRVCKLELDKKCEQDAVREKLSNAMEEIYYLLAPFTKGREISENSKKERKKDIAKLEVKKLNKNTYWQQGLMRCKELKSHACINDNSTDFKTLLNKANQYWNCDFDDEIIYFVMVDSSIGSSIVLTSERCYIYGKVYSTEQKYVFPIDRISTFSPAGKKKEYNMFFDVDYFKENYFDCSDDGVCFNTVKFHMFNIPEDAGESVCATLTSLEEEIRKPMIEKKKKTEYYKKAIEQADNESKAEQLVNEIKKDTILDINDKEMFLKKAQLRLEKYQNTATNKQALTKLLSAIKKDDLRTINSTLNQILSNELFDENDKTAISKLIDMQLEIGNKLYEKVLTSFFKEKSVVSALLLDKPIYMKNRGKDVAKEMCEFFISTRLEVEDDEVPLLLFKNGSQYRSVGSAIPDAEKCLITNKRLVVLMRMDNYEIHTLDDVKIKAADMMHGQFVRDKNDKPIPFCFPYVKVEQITDKEYKNQLQRKLNDADYVIVAKELNDFISGIRRTSIEIEKMKAVLEKLPTDNSMLKSLSKGELETEYTDWERYEKYGSKVTDYLDSIRKIIKDIYEKEASEMCTGLSEMSLDELKELKEKLDEVFSNKNFAHFIDGNKAVVKEEIQKRQDIAIREEIAENSEKLGDFTRIELENEYDKWASYTGNVKEVNEYRQMLIKSIEIAYKKEAQKMCVNLEQLTVEEAESLLSSFDKVFTRKQYVHFVEGEKQIVQVEIQKKKDMLIRMEISETSKKLDVFTIKELEEELTRWEKYNGKVTEVKDFINTIIKRLGDMYKKEARNMCENVGGLSIEETKKLLKTLNHLCPNKENIKEEISLVEKELIKKQENDIQTWIPESLDNLSVKELNCFIVRYDSGNYDTSLYSKYVIPLLEKRNALIVSRAEQIANFTRAKATLEVRDKCLKFETRENILSNLQQQTLAEVDTLVCSIGTPPNTCGIYLKKLVNKKTCLVWNNISYFEIKKSLFRSTLIYRCKDGTTGEIDIQIPSAYMAPIAELLKEILSFMMKTDDAMVPSEQPLMNSQSRSQPQSQPQLTLQPSETTETGTQVSLLGVQRSCSDMAGFVNHLPSVISTCIIGTLNPKFSKRVKNAVKTYAFSVREEDVFAIFDDTILGSGKEGFVMTTQGMIVKKWGRDTFSCNYSDIKGIKIIYDESAKLTKLYVDTQYGLGMLSAALGESGSQTLADRINEVVKYLYGLDEMPYIIEKSSQEKVNY